MNFGIAENVQWVLKDVKNMMKGALDNEYFIKLFNLVEKKYQTS